MAQTIYCHLPEASEEETGYLPASSRRIEMSATIAYLKENGAVSNAMSPYPISFVEMSARVNRRKQSQPQQLTLNELSFQPVRNLCENLTEKVTKLSADNFVTFSVRFSQRFQSTYLNLQHTFTASPAPQPSMVAPFGSPKLIPKVDKENVPPNVQAADELMPFGPQPGMVRKWTSCSSLQGLIAAIDPPVPIGYQPGTYFTAASPQKQRQQQGRKMQKY